MLYTISRKQFVNQVLSDYCVWTDLIRDSENFHSKYYFDETNTFYMATNYGGGDTVEIFSPYSPAVLARARNLFSQAVGFGFACRIDEYTDAQIHEKHGITFHYKFLDGNDTAISDIQMEKIADEDSAEILKTYDAMYLSFLRENHGARLLNYWKREKDKIMDGTKCLYIARNDAGTPIGFAMVDHYPSLHACDITQITIEDVCRGKGYGKQLLCGIVCDVRRKSYDVYYSSVNGDNIASQKTAESVGFKAVACRIQML